MTTPQTHAALLISLKDSDFWPADMSLNKWADLVCDELRRLDAENQRLQALLAKLQPAQEPAQAGELPEPDADFLTRCERTDELIEYVKAYARAALAARKPFSDPQARLEAFEDLIEDLSEWSRHVIEDTAPATLETHARKVLKRHGINGLEVKP